MSTERWRQSSPPLKHIIPQTKRSRFTARYTPSGNRNRNDPGLIAATERANALRIDRDRKLKEHVTMPDLRDQVSRILTIIGKFAVDSAVNHSLKAVTGRKQVHKIVQEGFTHQPALNDKKKQDDLKVVMEEQQAKEEGMQEDMNTSKQGNKVSAKSVNGFSDPETLKKKPNQGLNLLKTDKKRVFIRSRL